jgi:CAAX prenyl protease-like protein
MGVIQKLRSTPLMARVAPFFIFAAITSCQALFGEDGKYFFYAAKTFAGVWLLWAVWPAVPEMRWKIGWDSLLAGVGILVVWIALDPYYPKFTKPDGGWNPLARYAAQPALAWFFIIVRIAGSTLVVPPMEEMFYRSFVYRYVIKQDFDSVPLRQFDLRSFLITSVLFGFVHQEWLAGILCGMAYQWVVLRRGRLGEAMSAHAITNFLLGAWIVWKGAWHFW